MTVPSYTEEDVELVARARLADDWGAAWEKLNDRGRERYRGEARSVLAALSVAGRLLPPGSETEEEWTMRYNLNGKPQIAEDNGHVFDSRHQAEQHIEAWRRFYPSLTYSDVEYLKRHAIRTPWSPSVPDTKEETA